MAGPYCRFCGQRCFVLRVIPDGPSLIHALLRRYGGEAEITPGELRPQPCPWLTVEARGDGGILVRAR